MIPTYSIDGAFDEVIIVMSDIEMGSGGNRDDFPHSPFLADLIYRYLEGPLGAYPIHFVFNGDTFDLLKTPYKGRFPHHITKEVAVGKMAEVIATHPLFFEAIRAILDHPDGTKQASFVVGNHDAELLFPEVREAIQRAVGTSRPIGFPGLGLGLGSVWIEHGSQLDPLFKMDPEALFVTTDEGVLLNISWAMIALLDVFMPLHPQLYFYDRLYPKEILFELVPQVRALLMGRGWRYWTRDFWHDLLVAKDPLLDITWPMVKETIKRLIFGDPDVFIDDHWIKHTVAEAPHHLFVLGHLHRAASHCFGTKRVIQSGCLRDEYHVDRDGRTYTPILKGYYEIYTKAGEVVELVSREFRGPPRPAHTLPKSVYAMLPKVEELLQADKEE